MLGISFLHRATKQADSYRSRVKLQASLNKFLGEHGDEGDVHERDRQLLHELSSKMVAGDYVDSERCCPISGQHYKIIRVDGVDIDVCLQSRSIWFDAGELKHFTGLQNEVPGVRLASRASKYNCPVCGEQMREFQYKAPHNLMVDVCSAGHGVLLEEGEFERALSVS